MSVHSLAWRTIVAWITLDNHCVMKNIMHLVMMILLWVCASWPFQTLKEVVHFFLSAKFNVAAMSTEMVMCWLQPLQNTINIQLKGPVLYLFWHLDFFLDFLFVILNSSWWASHNYPANSHNPKNGSFILCEFLPGINKVFTYLSSSENLHKLVLKASNKNMLFMLFFISHLYLSHV